MAPIGPIGVSATWRIEETEGVPMDEMLAEVRVRDVARAPVSRLGYTGDARVPQSPARGALRFFVANFITRG